jgi:hypothetical protein
MATEKQIAAARENGRKSNGPVTDQGKLNSRRTKSRRRLLLESVVLDTEVKERFTHLLDSLRAELEPQTFIEDLFVEKMAVAQWRQMRLWDLEKFMLIDDVRRQLPDLQNSVPPPVRDGAALRGNNTTLNQYEMRFDRQFAASLSRFHQFRKTTFVSRSQQVNQNKPICTYLEPHETRTGDQSEPTLDPI